MVTSYCIKHPGFSHRFCDQFMTIYMRERERERERLIDVVHDFVLL